MPRVLITGGLGFIGGTVARIFTTAGWDVMLIDDLSNPTYTGSDIPHSMLHNCDVAEGVRRVQFYGNEPDLAVHCASPVGAAGVLQWRGRLAYEIMRTTQALAAYCATFDIPLVNISTSEVYGFSGTYHEHDALRVPHTVSARIEYAVGKLAAETAVRLLPHLRCINIRPFNVVGADQQSKGGFVVPTFAEQAAAGQPLTVYGDGTQMRAFVAVEDLASFIITTAELYTDCFDGRCINVGNPANATTINGLAQLFISAAGGGSITYTDGKAIHGTGYEEAEGHIKLPDTAHAAALGWRPWRDLDTVVQAALGRAVACR